MEVTMAEQFITFSTSNSILFGNNAVEQIPMIIKKMGAQRILVVTDKGLVQCGLIKRLTNVLQQVNYSIYDEVEETPNIETIRKITEDGRKYKFDLLIGFGGGSPMDAAKAVSALLTNEGDIEDYLGSDTIRKPGVKKILVPTTAGTGSEVTIFSVLARREKNIQEPTGIYDKYMLPEWAIVDPTLTVAMPPSLTANTGMDAFSHAAECYVNTKSNFLMEPLALEAIKLISQNIEKATTNGTDLVARYQMSAGSLLAGVAFSQTGTGLTHGLAETVQIPYKIPHGAAIAVILPHVMAFNISAKTTKYAQIARAMGIDSKGLSDVQLAERAVERVKEINARIGIPKNLSALRIPEKDLEKIAKDTMIIGEGYLKKNPRMANEQDLLKILENALKG
jgi:alcohol dehydrogenase